MCNVYSKKWRFNFAIKKVVMYDGGNRLLWRTTTVEMILKVIDNVDSTENLAVSFKKSLTSLIHVDHRVSSCRCSYYSLSGVEICVCTKFSIWANDIDCSSLRKLNTTLSRKLDQTILRPTQVVPFQQALADNVYL